MFEPRHNITSARIFVAFFFGLVLLASGLAPLLAATGKKIPGSMVYLFLAPVCHQLPERSFSLAGHGWGLCHRCCGLYLGILAAAALGTGPWMEYASRYRRVWAIGATATLTADALLPYASLWINTPFSRFTTGLLFGTMLGSLLVTAMAELLTRGQRRRRCSPLPDIQGGL